MMEINLELTNERYELAAKAFLDGLQYGAHLISELRGKLV